MMEPCPVAATVDAGGLMQVLGELARWEKLAGTPGERASLDHIRSVLDGHGFRTTLIEHDAYISLPGDARVEVDGRTLRARTHAMGLSTPPGGVTGRLVALGDGSAAAFAHGGLAGCIVLVDGIASPAVARRASLAGAVAQLHVSPHHHLHEMCISPVWGSPDPDTWENLPSTVALTISQSDGAALKARLAAGESPALVLHAAVDTGWRKTPLLVAEMDAPGAAPDGPFVMFSGHHDTWYFGVMDNGAANATMVEAARVLATRRADWRRGLRLCFWSGHSQGRYSGSSWYADTQFDELERRCAVHVNVDSTGGVGASVMGESGTASELAGFAAAAVLAETGQVHRGLRHSRNSDQSFWGIGIPSLFASLSHQPAGGVVMRNPLGWWWHTPEDLLDKIDPAALARDTRVFVHALHRLLTAPRLPLDHVAQLDRLDAELEALPAMDGVALDELRDRVATLRRLAATQPPDAVAMWVCRALVPLDYTAGDRFCHDPALPQNPWPVLDPLRRLAAAPPDSDAARLARVAAIRACNRIAHGLRDAVAAFDAGA